MKNKLKALFSNITLMFFIASFTTITYAVDHIVLVGDSILDNSYWNKVGADTTGQCLVKMLNKDNLENGTNVLIDDRSVEEATAFAMVEAIEGNRKITIPWYRDSYFENYIKRRERNNVAYDSKSKYSARLHQYCHIDTDQNIAQVDIVSDIKDSYVFISAGGNDLILHRNNPFDIINNLKKIGLLYKDLGAKKVTYIIPYTMTNNIGFVACCAINALRYIVKMYYLNSLSSEYYDDIIDLSDFDDTLRKAHNVIPEPTIAGAKEIADRIITRYKIQSDSKNNK